MTNSTAAALLLRDIILKQDNPYKDLFTPSRFHADPDVKQFIMQNADVAKHLVTGKWELPSKRAEDLANDEGAIVTVNGKSFPLFQRIHIFLLQPYHKLSNNDCMLFFLMVPKFSLI